METVKLNRREPKSCLGQVFNFKLGCLVMYAMKQGNLKNANNCLNTNVYSYLETSGGKSYILHLNVIDIYRHLWQFKTVVFQH
jgi:hypothetical protein